MAKEEAKTEEKKEVKDLAPDLEAASAGIALRTGHVSLNENGLPMHFNESFSGDNFFGKSSEIDVKAFKSSAEKENVDNDGLAYDSSSFDVMGRSMSAPEPTTE